MSLSLVFVLSPHFVPVCVVHLTIHGSSEVGKYMASFFGLEVMNVSSLVDAPPPKQSDNFCGCFTCFRITTKGFKHGDSKPAYGVPMGGISGRCGLFFGFCKSSRGSQSQTRQGKKGNGNSNVAIWMVKVNYLFCAFFFPDVLVDVTHATN